MYPPSTMCEPKYSEPSLHGNGETDLITKTQHKYKSVDHKNDTKVR